MKWGSGVFKRHPDLFQLFKNMDIKLPEINPEMALINNGTAVMQFLATPAGQQFCADFRGLIIHILQFVEKVHNRIHDEDEKQRQLETPKG